MHRQIRPYVPMHTDACRCVSESVTGTFRSRPTIRGVQRKAHLTGDYQPNGRQRLSAGPPPRLPTVRGGRGGILAAPGRCRDKQGQRQAAHLPAIERQQEGSKG